MILVSVGTQLPFDRLVEGVDNWASRNGRTDVVGQIGHTRFVPRAMTAYPFIPWQEFEEYRSQATLLVSHAGMGSILGALEMGKPLIIMPRLASLGEHRNDHQMATAQRFRGRDGIYVATDAATLTSLLDGYGDLSAGKRISPTASDELVSMLNRFLAEGDARTAGKS